MAITSHEITTETGAHLDISRLARPMLVLGVLLLGVLGFFLSQGGKEIYGSYLFGLIFWLSITLGMFGLSILHNTVRGTWAVPLIRLMEAGGGWQSLLLMAALFTPILLNLNTLYEWADPVKALHDHTLHHRAGYMNPSAYLFRFVLFFGIWIAFAWGMRNSALRQEKSQNFKLEMGRSSWGAVGLVMFFLTVTFALTDWVMSMDSHWYSTMFGTWFIICSCGAALAFCLVVFNSNVDKLPYRNVVSATLGKDMGNMQFVFTMLWGYTSLSQFLIIWNGNIPETTSYYKNRSSAMFPEGMASNHWGILGLVLILGRFFIPFFALIAPRVKRIPENLRVVGGWIFVLQIVEIYLFIQPSVPGRAIQGPLASHLGMDILSFLAIGAIWLSVFAAQTAKAPLIPTYDDRLEAMKHAH
jgi:hypothetical protein